MGRKKQRKIHLEDDLYEALKREAKERGMSVSAVVRERLLGVEKQARFEEIYESLPRRLDALRREIEGRIEERNREQVRHFLDLQTWMMEEVKKLDERLEKLEKATAVTAYYAAFTGLLQSSKFFNIIALSDSKWKALKDVAPRLKEEADEKVKALLGFSVLEKISD
ncbi:ribbon-helix-helix protein, CopG family [Thermodesulfatator autotrophicus]|uniref:Ribbon-helix-helix protein CopG domain-containing protein n=1 Tax=Thermodesulfatator autotrophicus TaxID=1795632 RepID=A0A177E5C4_9BACT|nr:ribbon-helix-helix protein, CopG family [Thermodesulfatator autotrophicus]OAG26701.1 hypothetical protein TH606_10940 [Thermodesulfatator autotrophicus]